MNISFIKVIFRVVKPVCDLVTSHVRHVVGTAEVGDTLVAVGSPTGAAVRPHSEGQQRSAARHYISCWRRG